MCTDYRLNYVHARCDGIIANAHEENKLDRFDPVGIPIVREVNNLCLRLDDLSGMRWQIACICGAV